MTVSRTIQTETEDLAFVVQERVVLYVRVSGDDRGKEGRNLAGQIEMGRDYAQEKAIVDLENQQQEFTAKLQADKFTKEEILTLLELSKRLTQKLDLMEDDFAEKRWYLNRLKFEARLMTVEGRKKVRFSCCLGEEVLSIKSRVTSEPSRQTIRQSV